MNVQDGLMPVCRGAIRHRVVYIRSFITSGRAADVQQEERWYQSYMRHLIR